MSSPSDDRRGFSPAEIDARPTFPSTGAEEIARKVEQLDLPPLADSFETILRRSDIQFRSTVEVDPRTLPDVLTTRTIAHPESILSKRRVVSIGGAIVRNVSLVVGEGRDGQTQFGDLPVRPLQLPLGEKAALIAPVPKGEGREEAPMLIFPEDYMAPPEPDVVETSRGMGAKSVGPGRSADVQLQDLAGMLTTLTSDVGKEEMKVARLRMYTVSGDIDDFWGVPGLTAKLYKYKGIGGGKEKEKEKEAAIEKIVLNAQSFAFKGWPLRTLFPFIDSDEIRHLPIANLELTYSEDESDNPLYQRGLRLEVDVQLRDGLQWVGESIKNLFRSSDQPPTIHLSAWLSEKRDWSKPPKLEKLVLQGYFRDMSLKPWNMVEFRTMGIELTATKSGVGSSGEELEGSRSDETSRDDDTADTKVEDTSMEVEEDAGRDLAPAEKPGSWHCGFGFIGEAMVINMPEASFPIRLRYRLARDIEASDLKGEDKKRKWSLTIVVNDWKDVFGHKNVHVTGAMLKTSFDERDFDSSVRLDITGRIKLGNTTFEVRGQFAKGPKHTLTETEVDHFIQARIGNIKLSDIEQLHRQIMGQELSGYRGGIDTAGQDVTLKSLSFRVSYTKSVGPEPARNALELLGEVTVGEVSSYAASLTFDTYGVTIAGAVSDVKIPNTNITIVKARLSFFIALNKGGTSQKTPRGAAKKKKALEGGDAGDAGEGGDGGHCQSKFEILGHIEYEKVTFEVGLYYAANKGEEGERDWLVYGSAGNIRLRDVWPSIENDSFLNLQLENVAVIASSKERPEIEQQELDEEEEEEEKEEEDGVENGTKAETVAKDGTAGEGADGKGINDSAPPNWDVLSQIGASHYPVEKGFQICTTISSFEQLEQLNNGKKIPLLMLCLGVNSQGEIKVAIRLPSSFEVRFSKFAYLHNFETSVGIGRDGPQLELRATLTVKMEPEDSKPIRVKGLIIGTLRGANGALHMDRDSRWINPLGLSEELIISKLGIDTGFDYATVLAEGPTRFALRGQVNIGEYQARMDVGVDITKASTVLQAELAKLDITKIARIAGTLARSDVLKSTNAVAAADAVVFSDVKLYLSSGATFMGEDYPRGIQVRGKLAFFHKTGEFDGSFTDDGVVVKAGIDAFDVGGLEVTSSSLYKGRRRAVVDIEMTKTTQRLFIDGIIRYAECELKAFINADPRNGHLTADIHIRLAEDLSFSLQGKVGDPDHPESAVWHFEGHLKASLVAAIGECIISGINALNTLATYPIEQTEARLALVLAELRAELREQEHGLERLKRELSKEERKRRADIEKELDSLREAHDEVDRLDEEYERLRLRKDRKEQELKEQRRRRDEAWDRLEKKNSEMSKQYELKFREADKRVKDLIAEKKRLEQQMQASWGDQLREAKRADESWAWWCKEENSQLALVKHLEKALETCAWWEKPSKSLELANAFTDLTAIRIRKAADAELRGAARTVMNTDAFKLVERTINEVSRGLEKEATALAGLLTEGPEAYIRVMSQDAEAELNRQRRLLDDLIAANTNLKKHLQAVKKALEEKKRRLTTQEEEAAKRIATLEKEIKLLPIEHDYYNKKEDYAKLRTRVDEVCSFLEAVKKGVSFPPDVLRHVTRLVIKGMPEVKDIRVRASSEGLVKNDPLLFEMTVAWAGQEHVCHVEWAPNQVTSVLYSEAVKSVAAMADI